MVVSIQLLLTQIDLLLQRFGPTLVQHPLYLLLRLQLLKMVLVDLLMEDVAPKEGEDEGSCPCDNCSPDNDRRTCRVLLGYDGGDEHSLDSPLDHHHSQSKQTCEELFMSQVSDGVE